MPPPQVELDHARLAMLAVLLTGVVGAGAGAGVPASAEIFDSNLGLAAVRDQHALLVLLVIVDGCLPLGCCITGWICFCGHDRIVMYTHGCDLLAKSRE